MRSARLLAPLTLSLLAACAVGVTSTDGEKTGLRSADADGASQESDDSPGSAGVEGSSTGDDDVDPDPDGGSSSSVSDASSATPPFHIDLDAFALPSQPSAPPSGDGMSCANLGCFDAFDCAIFHPAESAACKFTKCENLICK